MLISKFAKVVKDKPAYKEKVKTDSGYVWHYDSKSLRERAKEKKSKLQRLEKNIEKLRAKYKKDIKSDDLKIKAMALVVFLMDETAIRIGNIDSVKEKETFGATTLLVKHLKISMD